MDIWTLPIDGGTPTRLTVASAPFQDQFPCWSPDGKSIAFVRTQDDDRYRLGFRAGIYVVPATGGEVERITDETDRVNMQAIAWSPDGTMLAYISRDDQLALVGESGAGREASRCIRCERDNRAQ